MLTKTMQFDQDVIDIMRRAIWSDDGKSMKITEQLDRGLYQRVNKALEALGGKWNRSAQAHIFKLDPRKTVDGLLETGTLRVERDGFFETPDQVVNLLLDLADILPCHDVLEPSAGLGAIAKRLRQYTPHSLTCIEKNADRSAALLSMGFEVIPGDFLETPTDGNQYDRIVMNPPFEELQDIDHVMHAYQLLAWDGRLVSVMSESPFFRNDAKAVNFRKWLKKVGGYSETLPDGSFNPSGTGVNTRVVVINR